MTSQHPLESACGLFEQGHHSEAITLCEDWLRSGPDLHAILPAQLPAALSCGRACGKAQAFATAIALLDLCHRTHGEPARRALAEAHAHSGRDLCARHLYTAGIRAYKCALELEPAYTAVLANLGAACSLAGRPRDAAQWFRRAIDQNPAFLAARSNYLLALHYDSHVRPGAIAAEHRLHGAAWAATPLAPGPRRARTILRVGYISSDFRRHSVASFLEPLLAHHDPRRFKITCYSNSPVEDNVTRRLKSLVPHWRGISTLDDAEAAALIRRDGCDILVDLNGHTNGNRLGIFALQPAPAQATWLGYPDTTGLPSIQFRITDSVADPVGTADHLHTETLIRLPGCFLCYGPENDAPPVQPLPALSTGTFTFGSLNQHPKLSERTLNTWSRILTATPGSRLLLKSRSLSDPETAATLRLEFGKRGISHERLDLIPFLPSDRDHLGIYNRIDLALDPFPYNGATTTCEALWMGTPVLTLEGGSHVSRVGSTLLRAAGLPDFIARSPQQYVRAACRWTSKLAELSAVRAGLRSRMRESSLCDGPAFTRGMERLFFNMCN